MAVISGAESCVCTELVGNNLYVAVNDTQNSHVCCYDIDKNLWERLPQSCGSFNNLCTIGDYMYTISSDHMQIPQRYSFAKRQWQSIAKLDLTSDCPSGYELSCHSCNGAAVLHSKLYVSYGCKFKNQFDANYLKRFFMYRFVEAHNQWERKALTCSARPHFGSCIFVVKNRLYIAGGSCDVDDCGTPNGQPAAVEVYDEQNDTWSYVEQKHVPPNSLGAVEIEGRVYFLINKFPVDSGIRIPLGEVYPVCLGEWENLGNVGEDAALCNLPLKGNMRG